LNQTRYIETEGKTLVENFGLTEETIPAVMKRLFSETNGHPRQLLSVLKYSQAYEDLLNCMVPNE
jgi:hypothetical protein